MRNESIPDHDTACKSPVLNISSSFTNREKTKNAFEAHRQLLPNKSS